MKATRNIIMTGDRVLIEPDEDSEKSAAGLYLPPNVKEKERARGGKVIKTGPGYPIPESASFDESWKENRKPPRYFPLEATEGDYAIYLRSEAVDIEFENKKYVIVPYSSILALIRTEIEE